MIVKRCAASLGLNWAMNASPTRPRSSSSGIFLSVTGLTEAIFAEVNAHLADKGITLRSGTLVDATIIDAPSSTKNQARARDLEMSSTKKGQRLVFWHEGPWLVST